MNTITEILNSCPMAAKSGLVLRALCKLNGVEDYEVACAEYEEQQALAEAAKEMETYTPFELQLLDEMAKTEDAECAVADPIIVDKKKQELWNQYLIFSSMYGAVKSENEKRIFLDVFEKTYSMKQIQDLVKIQKEMAARLETSNH